MPVTSHTVWIFNGDGARFPSGVFSSRAAAARWVLQHGLTGLLTEYPLDNGVYDWAVQEGFFGPKREEQRSPQFIGGFTSARQQHVHFENGVALE